MALPESRMRLCLTGLSVAAALPGPIQAAAVGNVSELAPFHPLGIQIPPKPRKWSIADPREVMKSRMEEVMDGFKNALGEMVAKLQGQNMSRASGKTVTMVDRVNKVNALSPAVMARNPLRMAPFAAIIPGDSAVELVLTTGLYNFLNLYNTIIIARLVLTWFPNPPQFIAEPLSTICDPYLNLFRGIIPPIGGLDFSPVLAFTALNIFTNAAVALPCEMPKEEGEGAPATAAVAPPTTQFRRDHASLSSSIAEAVKARFGPKA
eukprot:jgi/Mesvir1/16309/Mv12761-RA.1